MGLFYLALTTIMFVTGLIVTGIGISGFGEIANEFANSLNIFSMMDGMTTGSSVGSFVFFISMLQSYYISNFVETFADEDSGVDKAGIFAGNIVLGCFLSLMYQSFPHNTLKEIKWTSTLVVTIPTILLIIALMLFSFVKLGILKGMYVILGVMFVMMFMLSNGPLHFLRTPFFIILFIVIIVANPVILGLVVAFAPPLIVLYLFGVIASTFHVPGVILMVFSFATSYVLTDFLNGLVKNGFESFAETYYRIINVSFFVYSIIVIGIWLKTVVIFPKEHSVTFEEETVSIKEGRVQKHGYWEREGTWDLYKNGMLEVHADGVYSSDEKTLPWEDNKSEIRYVNFDGPLLEINSRWFLNYKNLKSVNLPEGLKTISKKAFQGCDNLESFAISEENDLYTVEDGVLYSKDKEKLILCPNTKVDMFSPVAKFEEKWYVPIKSNKRLIYSCYQWNKDKPLLYYSSDFSYSCAKDVNNDGVKELFLSTSKNPGDEDTVLFICVNKNNEVKCLKALFSAEKIYCYVGDGYIVSRQRLGGRIHFRIEEQVDDSLRLLYDISSSTDGTDGNNYYLNDEAVTKKEYYNIYNNYVKTAQKVTFKAID